MYFSYIFLWVLTHGRYIIYENSRSILWVELCLAVFSSIIILLMMLKDFKVDKLVVADR